jgi:metal-sulfur cluster biosynthetic enzyme
MMIDPEMAEKIDSILERVKDPESGLSVARLGLVEKVRYNEEKKEMYIFTDFLSHRPGCLTCVGIAMAIMSTIRTDLEEEFKKEFPNLVIEFV